jgi:hypothetical protein
VNLLKIHQAMKQGRFTRRDLSQADREFLAKVPEPPKVTARGLFISKYYKSGKKDNLATVVEQWKILPQREKLALGDASKVELQKFVSALEQLIYY